MTSSWPNVAKRMKQRRLALGLTVEAAAERADISIPQWDVMENARRERFRTSSLRGIERALQWSPGSVDALLEGQDIYEEPPAPPELIDDLDADDDLVRKIRADLLAAQAWGTPQTWRLPVLHQLYELDEHQFLEWVVRHRADVAVVQGELDDLRAGLLGILTDVEEAWVDATVSEPDFELGAAADLDVDEELAGRSESPSEFDD